MKTQTPKNQAKMLSALVAVAEAAEPFADHQTCLDEDCQNNVCVLNKALENYKTLAEA